VKKTYQYLTHSIRNKDFDGLFRFFNRGKEPYWQFSNIAKIEQEYGVKSTFFFLNESIKFNPFNPYNWPFSLGRYNINSKKIRNVIRFLDRKGWEIGIHGSVRSYNNSKLFNEEKKNLEKILAHKISGGRQHWLNLEIPHSWKIHKDSGLKYDSTFGRKYNIGFKDDIFHSFSPFGDDFLVFPIAIMDSYLFDKYPNFEDAVSECSKIIDKVYEEQGLLTILWHQSTFNKKDFKNYSRVYKYILERCQNLNAWFGTCHQAHNHISSFVSK